MGTQNKINKKELKMSRISYREDSEMMTPLASILGGVVDRRHPIGLIRDMSPNP